MGRFCACFLLIAMIVADDDVDVFGMTAQDRADAKYVEGQTPAAEETPQVEDTLCSGNEVESGAADDECLTKGGVDPDKCAVELGKQNDCFLFGSETHHGKRSGETCLQCLLMRPGIGRSGCTLVLLKAWCEYGYEDAPENIQEEEASASSKGLISMFEKSHTKDVETIQQKLHSQIAMFATLLAKFDNTEAEPHFTDDESKVMLALLGSTKDSTDIHQAVKDKVSVKTRDEWTRNGKKFMQFIAKKRLMNPKGLEAMDSFSPVEYGLQAP